MCGIYGYIKASSEKKALETCLDGLQKLQYRGYDSAGVAAIHNGSILSFKTVGKVDLLTSLVKESPKELSAAIAHTRWATHGRVSSANTHPQIDYKESLALVHNGIIENYLEVKKRLESKGVTFSSETDTEVCANLISYYYDGDMLSALTRAFADINGSFAIVLMHKDFPETIYASARGCPLAIGICEISGDVYISSDSSSFSESSYSTYFLQDNEIAKVDGKTLTIYDDQAKEKKISLSPLTITENETLKDGYEHFMLKEIHEQKGLIERILHKRKKQNSFYYRELEDDKDLLNQVQHIEIIACGSSYHAGLIAKEFLEQETRIPVSVHLGSQYRYAKHLDKANTLAIIISQSGETADTLAALESRKEHFLLTIALCNVENSTLTRKADRFIPLMAKKEVSVCSTKAFTAQLLNLYLLGIHLANALGASCEKFTKELLSLPLCIESVYSKEKEIASFAKEYSSFPYFFFVGRGQMYPVCLEAALKLKEISYLPAEALPAGEMKHGPIALIDEKLATIAFLTKGEIAAKTISNLSEIRARNGRILTFGGNNHEVTKDQITFETDSLETFLTIPYSIAGQIFSYYLAKELDREIDFPRNLAKSVTVE
ncbi:glutamine--fructose-6-phosphate transaminase (isomerizing) [bacterium]|nr:glutamine--fructose-6-phosphate transaminase (isomerizing) [bacterium]